MNKTSLVALLKSVGVIVLGLVAYGKLKGTAFGKWL